MRTLLLFGVGSPLAIDLEESCLRLGDVRLVAVRNVDGPVYVSDAVPVVVPVDLDPELLDCEFAIPIFTPGHRRKALASARRIGLVRQATLVDPTSALARSAAIGAGTWINAGCVIGGASRIGGNVFVNRATSIGHHCVLDDFCSIGPGVTLAGSVRIGSGTVIGAGVVVHPETTIGADCVVAAGSVVKGTVPDGSLLAGHPARVVRSEAPAARVVTS